MTSSYVGVDDFIVYDPSAPPGNSNPKAPLNNHLSTPEYGALVWERALGYPTGYYLWLGSDGGGISDPTNLYNGVDIGDTTAFNYYGLANNTTYYWKVVPYNGNGNATGSNIYTFTIRTDSTIDTFPYLKNFENNGDFPVSWLNESADVTDWLINTGPTPTNNTGPTGDHTDGNGHYAYIEATGMALGFDANLQTPAMDISSLSLPVIDFWYHMYGATMGSMHLDYLDINTGIWTEDLWSMSGNQGNQWYQASVSLVGLPDNIVFRFRGICGYPHADNYSNRSDMCIDDFAVYDNLGAPACTVPTNPVDNDSLVYEDGLLTWQAAAGGPTGYRIWLGSDGLGVTEPTNVYDNLDVGNVTSFTYTGLAWETTYYWKIMPYNSNGDAVGCSILTFFVREDPTIRTWPWVEDFEHNDQFPPWWINLENDDFNWHTQSGHTAGSGTGPSFDHTTGGGYYVYVQAIGHSNDLAILETPPIDLATNRQPALDFWYHMYGSQMGTLSLDILDVTTDSLHADVWSLSGDQNDMWHNTQIDLSVFTNDRIILQFNALCGNGRRSDIAIDDVAFLDLIPPDDDLACTEVTGNLQPQIGMPEVYTIEVSNPGLNDQDNYLVQLLEGNTIVGEITGQFIEQYDTLYFDIIWTPTVPGPIQLSGQIELQADTYSANNVSPPLDIVVPAPQAGIYGRVTDSLNPLSGVQILIEELSVVGYTDDTGNYSLLGVPPGTYSVTASLFSCNSVTIDSVYMPLGLPTELDFVLGYGTMLAGMCYNNSGYTVPLATISIVGTAIVVNSDPQGYFRIENLTAGFYDIRADKDGYETQIIENVEIVHERVNILDFNMIEFAQVVVNVAANCGTTSGAIITFADENGEHSYFGEIADDGVFIAEIYPGVYTLTVSKQHYIPYVETDIDLTSGVVPAISVLIIEEQLPPENLSVDSCGLFRWDVPGRMLQTHAENSSKIEIDVSHKDSASQDENNLRDLQHYEIYLDGNLESTTIETQHQFNLQDFVDGESYILGVKAIYDGGNSDRVTIFWSYVSTSKDNAVPAVTVLLGNIPNPFNPTTSINYNLAQSGQVSLKIYNTKGQLVRLLVNSTQKPGIFSIIWDGKNENSQYVKSGVYLYRLKTGRYTSTKKMILLK